MENIHGKKLYSVTHTDATAAKAAQGTPSSATARIVITDIAGSSDKNGAILTVKCGGTDGFQIQLAGSATPQAFSHSFETPIVCDASENATVEVDGTALCKANIVGYLIP